MSSTTDTLRTTPLHAWHKAAGANMADFGGYEMPLWYPAGTRQEHLAVLTAAGLFDTCHMASLKIDGRDTLSLLQHCFTRDIAGLADGRCAYGAFLDENGHCLDDALVYRYGEGDFGIVVNAGMGPVITAHLQRHAADREVMVRDLTGLLGKIDIQGPLAARILAPLLADGTVLSDMVYFSFKGRPDDDSTIRLKNGEPLLLSRTGYTGEFGFEIFLAPEAVPGLWQALLDAGRDMGILPCGLAARDSLRSGAVLPLSHQDIGKWPFINHPWPFALPWNPEQSAFTKEFVGRAALEAGSNHHTLPFVGADPRKVGTEQARALDGAGKEIGTVLTCTTDMGITLHEGRIVSVTTPGLPQGIKFRGLSCGFVMVDRPLAPGAQVVLAEGGRSIPVTIVTDVRPDRSARKAMKNFLQ